MRRIGALAGTSEARRLSDALFAHGIANDVREDEDGAVLWVHDDARLDEAKVLLGLFRADPDADRFAEDAAAGAARKRDKEQKDAAYRRRVSLARQSIHGADGRGWVSLALLGLSLGVALIGNLGSNFEVLQPFFLTTAPPHFLLPEIRSGEVWRLFTPVLVHFGVMHLAFNLYMWWGFAQQVEARKGPVFFGVMVLVTAAASNLGEFAWGYLTAPGSVALVGGLSGVLYAIFGYVWTKSRIDPQDRLGVSQRTVNILLGWLVICMLGVMGSVANAAHVVGLVVGMAWAYGDVAWFQWRKRP